VQRVPAAPPKHAIPHEGYQLTADRETMSALLDRMVAEKGWDATRLWAGRFINRGPLGPTLGDDPDLVGRITQRLKTETTQMEAKVKELIRNFQAAAVDDTKLLLNNSEKQVKAEATRYGLKVSGYVFKDYSMDAGPLRTGLQDASKALAIKRRECDQLRATFLKAQTSPAGELNPGLKYARTAWVAQEDVYHNLAKQKQGDYPILAAYTTVDEAASKLEELSTQDASGVAKNLMKTVEDRLKNIETVRDEIGDRFSIWKTPQIIALTKKTMAAEAWQNRAIDDHARAEKAAAGDQAKIFAAIALGLGLLAAIPTGGSSVLASMAVAGAALGAAYSMYNLYEHYKDYSLASAESGSAFEKAAAVCEDEPSMMWLATDLIDLGMNVVGAAVAFKALRAAMIAAQASKLERLPQVIEEANRLGLTSEMRARVVAKIIEQTGGSTSVQEALKTILQTFSKVAPTIDAQLAKAYQNAATLLISQGRCGFYRPAAGETLVELKRVLRASGVEESKLNEYAKEIAHQFATNADTYGSYYAKLDIIILREGAPADALAHELAHRAQMVTGQFETMSTIRKEYQAFTAQREFLLMLPHDQVPVGFSTDLLKMTNEDIKMHVVANYRDKMLKDIRSGTNFSPFDETVDGPMILQMFKDATKRGLM
jgi:division protein CdvB (Snf7/Vps24/ESCRT-III family)